MLHLVKISVKSYVSPLAFFSLAFPAPPACLIESSKDECPELKGRDDWSKKRIYINILSSTLFNWYIKKTYLTNGKTTTQFINNDKTLWY